MYGYVGNNPVHYIDPSGLLDLNLHDPNSRAFDYWNNIDYPDLDLELSIGGHGNSDKMADDRLGVKRRQILDAQALFDIIQYNKQLLIKLRKSRIIKFYSCEVGKKFIDDFSEILRKHGYDQLVIGPEKLINVKKNGDSGIYGKSFDDSSITLRDPNLNIDFDNPGIWIPSLK